LNLQIYQGELVGNTPLEKFVALSEDSTYLIFTFIYTCHYCQNSVANLNEYEKTGVVDKVIGLTIKDSIGTKFFIENYSPDFSVVECNTVEFLQFNSRFPTSFYIKDNIIKKVFRGELPVSNKFFKEIKRTANTKNATCDR
jgi:hypothetical protein